MAYHLIATNILKKENQRILDVIISLFLTCLWILILEPKIYLSSSSLISLLAPHQLAYLSIAGFCLRIHI